MSRKIFLNRVKDVLRDDETMMDRMIELQSLRNSLIEQNDYTRVLKQQLQLATENQMMLEALLSEISRQLQQQFDKVSVMCERIFSKSDDDIEMITPNNRIDGSQEDEINETQEISSMGEQPHEQPERSDLLSELSIQSESSTPQKKGRNSMVWQLRNRKRGTTVSNVSGSVVHHFNEQKCNQRVLGIPRAALTVDNRLIGGVLAHLKTENPSDDSEQLKYAPQLQKFEARLTRNSSKKSRQTTHVDRKKSKMYSCSECSKQFTNERNFIRHSKIHTDAKPFVCLICNMTFTRNKSLTQHKKIHAGVYPFECSTCKAGFAQKSSLVQHSLLHTNKKPFKCDICEKGFRCKQNLRNHMNVHSGLKSYKCNLCEKEFTYRGTLMAHQRNSHA